AREDRFRRAPDGAATRPRTCSSGALTDRRRAPVAACYASIGYRRLSGALRGDEPRVCGRAVSDGSARARRISGYPTLSASAMSAFSDVEVPEVDGWLAMVLRTPRAHGRCWAFAIRTMLKSTRSSTARP